MSDYQFLTYETVDDGRIARILLNRPEARNAQNRRALEEGGVPNGKQAPRVVRAVKDQVRVEPSSP